MVDFDIQVRYNDWTVEGHSSLIDARCKLCNEMFPERVFVSESFSDIENLNNRKKVQEWCENHSCNE